MTLLRTRKAFAVLAMGLMGLAPGHAAAASLGHEAGFYDASPALLPGPPGSLIRTEPIAGAPLEASAYRVLYRSIGLRGEPIAVSGVVVVPSGSPPAGGRAVVAWAHPTTGVVSRCAPSLDRFVFQTMIGLRDFVAAGNVVVATDYPGLGTPGPTPYLIGDSEGRAVLDSVRAARLVPGSAVGPRFVAWGHSQGGHAAIFAGLLAKTYAPELHPIGLAMAAPATDLATLIREDLPTDGGRNLTAMTLWAWSQVFGVPLDAVIEPDARASVDRLAGECLESVADFIVRWHVAAPLKQRFLRAGDVTAMRPWSDILAANVAGLPPSSIPVFVSQGDADKLVRPDVTAAYVHALCNGGSTVQAVMLPGVNHGWSGYASQAQVVRWIRDRVADLPASSTSPAAVQTR